MMALLEHITVAESDVAEATAPVAGTSLPAGAASPAGAPEPAAEAQSADAQPGRLVAGRYRLGSLLGRGGMARVFLAYDELLRRPVALKRPIAEPAGPPAIGMLDEAWAATRVNHHGAVKVLDVVRDDGLNCIVMEALRGRTLGETIEADGRSAPRMVKHLALRLLDAVQAVHRAGFLHRDIKPSNVFLCEDGRVVLIDFGIACPIADLDNRLPTGAFMGSLPYASPEVLNGNRPGPASDMFSLGATLYTAVEGRSPFDRGDLNATISAAIEGLPAPFAHAGPLCPVIARLLAVDPGRRPTVEQAREILSDLDV
ncbi:serine/threonine protein kinase [Actinoplanes sp. TBRC 11911]|uniref:serine/threonine-protein kinase n=1 Tax=Actinoplanes sp. TBRC 11911 TaxID=2729386 RepID=UPI00145D87B5|nr:serine/threonine-protein kinase [Actinoplanes sp. TBRC 11911]NMO54570.1 serine/threonine protein kinase [Actinoplanes sp. TBRC 11911]